MWNSSSVGPPVIAPTWARPWGTAHPSTSAVGLILRELTWLALLVQLVWFLATPSLAIGRVQPEWGAVLLVVAAGAWLMLLATQFYGGPRVQRWARYADVAAVAAAGMAVGLSGVAGAADVGEAAGSLAILTAVVVGAMLPAPFSVAAIAVLAVLALPSVLRLTPGYATGMDPADGWLSAYVLAAGLGIAGVRGALVRHAERRDRGMRDRERQDRNRLLIEGVESALRVEERLLHETVLNTLTAISRGGIGWSAQATRILHVRCREAADVLRRLASGEPSPVASAGLGVDVDDIVAALRADGLAVTIVVDVMDDVPSRVTAALGTAVREALNNVARHARADRVWVLVRVNRGAGLLVRAEVRDDGVGFDTRRASRRFGLAEAIADPMSEVGGVARLTTRPGDGTRVVLVWEKARPRVSDALLTGNDFAMPPSAAVGLFCAVTASLAWLQFGHPPLALTDAALILAFVLLIAMAAAEAPLSWGLVAMVCALGPALALMRVSAGQGSGSAFGGGWALSATAGLFVMAAALGPRWSWVPLLLGWLVVDWDLTAHVLQPATAVIAGAAVLGRLLRQETVRMEESTRARAAADVAHEVRREGLARLRERYAALGESGAVGLLGGIAEGQLDPEDLEVRRRSGLEETFIRNVMRNDPKADDLRALVGRLAQLAYRRCLLLQTDVALPPMADVVLTPGVGESFGEAVAYSVPDGSARLAVRTEGEQVVMRLLTPIVEGERDMMMSLAVPGQVTDPDDPGDPVLMWEVRLPWTEKS
jgi:signal transduction histidine kinase